MKRIVIDAIAPSEARLPCYAEAGFGDWHAEGDTLHVSVVAPTLDDDTFLTALHELIEAKLCMATGVTQAQVDAFDQIFKGPGEPGDDLASPYRRQHRRALLIEFLVADFLGIDGYCKME